MGLRFDPVNTTSGKKSEFEGLQNTEAYYTLWKKRQKKTTVEHILHNGTHSKCVPVLYLLD